MSRLNYSMNVWRAKLETKLFLPRLGEGDFTGGVNYAKDAQKKAKNLEVGRTEEERELAVGWTVFHAHQDLAETFFEVDALKAFVEIPVA